MAVVFKHITAPLPSPREVNSTIPEVVERVVLKAMAKDPADRYQTAGEMARAMEEAVDASAVSLPTVLKPVEPVSEASSEVEEGPEAIWESLKRKLPSGEIWTSLERKLPTDDER
jgi:serine/threonine-protein kinase